MSTTVLPRRLLAAQPKPAPIHVSPLAVQAAALDPAGVYALLETRPDGLTSDEAAARLVQYGANVLGVDRQAGFVMLLWRALLNPLVILLAVLATISFATGDSRSAVMMLSMIALSVTLRLIQESKAGIAAAKLKAMITVTATVRRGGPPQEIAVRIWCPEMWWSWPRAT